MPTTTVLDVTLIVSGLDVGQPTRIGISVLLGSAVDLARASHHALAALAPTLQAHPSRHPSGPGKARHKRGIRILVRTAM